MYLHNVLGNHNNNNLHFFFFYKTAMLVSNKTKYIFYVDLNNCTTSALHIW